MSAVRSFVELDVFTMRLLIANETSSMISVDLDGLRQQMRVRVEPVEAEITWQDAADAYARAELAKLKARTRIQK